MARCEDCGCEMDGGFCPNCHEEVFIAAQYSEIGECVPESIAKKAREQVMDPSRIKQAKKIREAESAKRREQYKNTFGE